MSSWNTFATSFCRIFCFFLLLTQSGRSKPAILPENYHSVTRLLQWCNGLIQSHLSGFAKCSRIILNRCEYSLSYDKSDGQKLANPQQETSCRLMKVLEEFLWNACVFHLPAFAVPVSWSLHDGHHCQTLCPVPPQSVWEAHAKGTAAWLVRNVLVFGYRSILNCSCCFLSCRVEAGGVWCAETARCGSSSGSSALSWTWTFWADWRTSCRPWATVPHHPKETQHMLQRSLETPV